MKARRPRLRRVFSRPARSAFSLLEVILALAILGISIAMLGEAARLGLRNADLARQLTQAQLLCESKMAEIEAGILTTDPVSDVPIEPIYESNLESSLDLEEYAWVYSIESTLVDEAGLLQVTVTVAEDLPPEKKPVVFSLTRLMLDDQSMSLGGSEEAG